MCGICGFVGGAATGDPSRVLAAMTESLSHRGPDDHGSLDGPEAWLGHRRLSIIDVSGGRQPLFSEDGRIAVVCNGEIYNHAKLRHRLQQDGHTLATRSDCEVIAHLWEDRGPEMLADIDGMFAMALFDSRDGRLLLARDRMGKKPLFWSPISGGIVFGSELRSVLAHPGVSRRISPDALYRYLTLDYVPTPLSMIDNVFKVEPGGYVLHGPAGTVSGRFHDLVEPPPFEGGPEQAASAVWDLLVEATGRRLESEVPLGVFLSGGLDSCSVLAAMSSLVDPKSISTFTIGFEDPTFDESAPARSVAAHFGTRHHEKVLCGRDALNLVNELATIADEPLADYSIIPTTLLSRFAKQHISVALSGDGGDELFYGYESFKVDRLASLMSAMLPRIVTNDLMPRLASLIPVSDGNMGLDYKIDRMIRGLKYNRFERHLAWIGGFDPPSVIGSEGVLSMDFRVGLHAGRDAWWPDVPRILSGTEGMDPLKRLAILYMRLYLQDGVLAKVDRASMNSALEVRSPFLDTAMVRLALSMRPGLNLGGGHTKAVVRRMLKDRVPASIVSAPKKGFGVPMSAWLKTDLKPLLDRHLSKPHLNAQGIFNPAPVQAMIDAHIFGRHNFRKELFSLLVFQLWHEQWICN